MVYFDDGTEVFDRILVEAIDEDDAIDQARERLGADTPVMKVRPLPAMVAA
jgi:hypothetical protein